MNTSNANDSEPAMPAIQVSGLGRDYGQGEHSLTVLNDVDLEVSGRECIAITGPSGSGKSTMLGLLAGLDRPTRGSVRIAGTEITSLPEEELSRLRARNIGFVFQSFQLIATLTALENVRLPAEILGDREAAARAEELLERVGLRDRADHYPSQLSGGEMQRTAIARASVTRPAILLADEPTGNLDSVNGKLIMDLLLELNRTCTLVLVTHNPEIAAVADREIRLRDGSIERIVLNKKKGNKKKTARKAGTKVSKKAARKSSGKSSQKPSKKAPQRANAGAGKKKTKKAPAKRRVAGRA